MRKTGIICTLGPASETLRVLEAMADAGMTVARINCSHGSRAQHRLRLELVDRLNKKTGRHVKRMLDLQGYRMRVRLHGRRKEIFLEQGATVYLAAGENPGRKQVISLDYPGSLVDIPEGSVVYIDDGNVALSVEKRTGDVLKARVAVPGPVKNGKGVNIPNVDFKFSGLTDRDRADVELGLRTRVDFIAQSFVRNAEDMLLLDSFRTGQGLSAKLIAKIENRQGVTNLDEIMRVCEGIMVARGDLGVSVPVFQVPVLQKKIIAKCRSAKRFVITATQMLESMTTNPRPTRAEVSDVANAVIDGSDYVMLSAETAIGRHPVETVRMMKQVVQYTESYLAGRATTPEE